MKQSNLNLPSTIGVYIFKNHAGEILYIGKSVNIKARVKSHFENAKLDAKERAIVTQAAGIDTIPTESEFKALLLESQLIQKHRPKYNKVWMDDKSYLYVKITASEEYPKISLIRKSDMNSEEIKNQKSKRKADIFFGPFSSRRTLENLLREIRRVIPFCSAQRITKRPCFYSKIGLCNPCPNYIEQLKIQNSKLKTTTQNSKIYNLNVIPAPQRSAGLTPAGILKKKIKIPDQQLKNNMVVRSDKIIGLEKIYKNNIRQIIKIFEGKIDLVIKNLRHELDQLSKTGKYEDAILIRDRIMKFEKLISERSFSDGSYSSTNYELLTTNFLNLLRPFFPNLSSLHRIECYDVSNLGGKQATAAMTVALDGQIDKSQYRKFRIQNQRTVGQYDSGTVTSKTVKMKNQSTVSPVTVLPFNRFPSSEVIRKYSNVDWELMRGIFERRFAHNEWELPDLILVDGGKPQVRMAINAMQNLKLNISVVGIAKNPDRLVIGVSTDEMPTKRPELNHPGFNLIRLLRDEAHRFGRKYHLLLRKKVSGY